MTPILVVDASLQGVSVVLADAAAAPGRRLVWVGSHPENQGAVAAIARLGGQALAAAGGAPLAGLAVSTGPGSFTGIKVGLAFAYGFRGGTPALPMLAMSALEVAAAELAGGGGPLALFVPATRTHGYWAVAAGEESRPAALLEVGPVARDALGALPAETRLAVSGRWPLLTEMISESGRSASEQAPSEVCRLAICGMAERAAARWPRDYSLLLPPPRYLRLSTAEERRESTTATVEG